ncbi:MULTISPECIES: MEKHLA domain-containing protein [unclassified Cyanobium]|uniref:MEKHLA domain-containing protein n=1 Tax=unclassified Cyanobium TaxID=2627006 RepID=UPI0028F4051A|nr:MULTISPECIES: MEKHLA domain-containing protein [unclassified Cyanobium]MCP9834006.1 MEKHLA domain-containing protein [Cyanobium sp. La Preciosa 7G6]MCP9936769.1 MEKHLA domain-containing protein [Cyanobium sp. Aljojuca 7A6]
MPRPEPPPWLSAAAIATAERLLAGHRQAFGRPLLAGVDAGRTPLQAAQELFVAATVVLSHDGAADPRLIYANRAALLLWRRPWGAMVGLPSRLTAEPAERQRRALALEQARRKALSGYSGIRVDSGGRRFRIQNARLWALPDGGGQPGGQAAAFSNWWWLEPPRSGSPPPLSGRPNPVGGTEPGPSVLPLHA